MRIRPISVLAVLALVLAACSPSSSEPASTTTTSPAAAATTTTSTLPEVEESPEAMLLSYSLEPGSSMEYEVDIDQTIEMTATGDASAMGDEEFPGDLSVNVKGTTSFSHTVAAGPEPGTYEITITGDVSGLEFSGTMDGAPIDNGEIPDLAAIDPVDVTVIVDDQGNIIPADDELGDLLGGGFGDLGSLGSLGSGSEMGRFIGPPFADKEVTVGDSWSETIETPNPMGDAPVVTTIDSEVTGVDTIDGADVLVIETTSTTSMIEFDLAEFLLGFFLAFVPEDATAEETAQLDAIAEGLRFLFVIDETLSDMTTWFDAEAGLARRADFSSSTHLVMDINMPDEETNELIAFGLDMDVSQNVTYRLVAAESA